MFTNRTARRHLKSATALAVAALAITGWLWLAQGDSLQIVLAATLVAGLAIFGVVAWDFQKRAWDRWQDAVDAYADLEIERAVYQKSRRTT
jgi:hypothetical protein